MKLLLCLLPLLLVASASAETWVYVSLSGDHKIALYQLDPESGKLTHREDFPAENAPGALCVDPAQKYLLASLRGKKMLGSYPLDAKTGQLGPVRAVPVEGGATFVATDRTGKVLLSAYYGEGKVSLHTLNDDGTINPASGKWWDTQPNAHAILPDPSNRFVFVPHTGPRRIYRFELDLPAATLKIGEPAHYSTPEDTGPRHLAYHPKLKNRVYFVNELGSNVTTFELTEAGQLNPLQTLSTLPEGYTGNNTCAEIRITPDGRFLYCSNRGHDSLAGFAIEATTGKLTALAQTPTAAIPRSFNIDPTGRILIAAGQQSNTLVIYRIDSDSGALKPLETLPCGKTPSWVEIVRFE